MPSLLDFIENIANSNNNNNNINASKGIKGDTKCNNKKHSKQQQQNKQRRQSKSTSSDSSAGDDVDGFCGSSSDCDEECFHIDNPNLELFAEDLGTKPCNCFKFFIRELKNSISFRCHCFLDLGYKRKEYLAIGGQSATQGSMNCEASRYPSQGPGGL